MEYKIKPAALAATVAIIGIVYIKLEIGYSNKLIEIFNYSLLVILLLAFAEEILVGLLIGALKLTGKVMLGFKKENSENKTTLNNN